MERDATSLIGPGSAVFEVALDRTFCSGQLCPDLVMPSGPEVNLQEVILLRTCQYKIGELCKLRSLDLFVIDI